MWQPGRAKASQTASSTFAYTISATAPSSVTTKTLLPNGTGYVTNIGLLDSLLRERQTLECSRKSGGMIHAASSWMCRYPSSYSWGVK